MRLNVRIGKPADALAAEWFVAGAQAGTYAERFADGSAFVQLAGWPPGDDRCAVSVQMLLTRAEAGELRRRLVGLGRPCRGGAAADAAWSVQDEAADWAQRAIWALEDPADDDEEP